MKTARILLKDMVTFISHSPTETEELGAGWGRECGRGWLIGLSGDLGAGKTQLVKGLARGLMAGARVTSPTYALVHEYPGGRLPFFHVDLYRLETREQIIAAGLEEYLVRPDGVTVVEWVERWLKEDNAAWFGPGRFRRARLKILGETDREICYEDFGG
jgi:tRNA threonylcarbamoyladenosine biosynthesis protein TsaE